MESVFIDNLPNLIKKNLPFLALIFDIIRKI